jgi:anti-anti-sigma regulatory factor
MTRDFEYFRVEQRGDVTVATPAVSDLFDLAVSCELRKEMIRFVQDEKPKKVVVDFHNIQRFSTDWITTLLSLKKRVVETGGDVKLCSMSPVQREIIDIFHLVPTVFQILDTVEEAVQAFS